MLPEGIRRVFRVRRGAADQTRTDVHDEIRFHLETRIDELMADGRDRAEAEQLAGAEFGDVEAAKRALGRVSARRERSRRRVEWLEELAQDLRFGWRKLLAERGFAAVAVLTLALGIGANTAIFSVVNAVLIRPLPYPEANRLVMVWEVTPDGEDHNVVSRGNFMDWRDQAQSFAQIGAWGATGDSPFRDDDGNGRRILTSSFTPGAFRALGATPILGRTFTDEEGIPGSDDVVVLGQGFWREQYGADPDILGRRIMLEGSPRTVIGVMPASFDFPEPGVAAWGVWSLDEESRQNRRSHNLQVIARLARGVTVDRAQAEMDGMAARAAEAYPENMTGWGVNVQPFRADLVASTRPTLLVLLGVVGMVLLLACANLANLFLARALARDREVAVRGALGAGRGRLVRQFLTEAGLIAALGGALGFGITAAGLNLFVALAPADIPLLEGTRIDPLVFGFTAGITILAMVLSGLIPALRVSATDLQSALRARTGASAGAGRLRAGLLVAEVALAVVLLVGAGLLIRTAIALQNQDFGFERHGLLTAYLNLPDYRYPNGTPDHVDWYGRLLDRLEAVPGVESAAGSTDLPAGFANMTFSFAIEGRPAASPSGREEDEPLRIVTAGYFETLGIPLVSGRYLSETDDADAAPVVVINEALRRKHWPDGNAVGHRISFQGPEGPWLEIVGVVGDTRHYAVDADPAPAMYLPYAQKRWDWTTWLNVIMRTDGDPTGFVLAFRNAVAELDPEMVPGRIAPLTDLYAQTNAQRRFSTILLVIFAALALVLGVTGVYGVLSYSVTQRTRELGLRIALGAPRSAVAADVVTRGLGLAGIGVAFGIALALGLSRFLESLVFGVGTRDPATFIGIPVALLLVAAVAAYLPARRATRVDPIEALRVE